MKMREKEGNSGYGLETVFTSTKQNKNKRNNAIQHNTKCILGKQR